MKNKPYLLIIDEASIEEKILDYFATFGFDIIHILSPLQINLAHGWPAALLINYTLLQKDVEIITQLHHQYPIPLIVISNNPDEAICIDVLEAGADDFIIKPIHPRELHARINAINRRVLRATQSAEETKEVLLFANRRLYPGSRQIFYEESELHLSANEYDLLLAFIRQPQRVLSPEYLLQAITTKTNSANRRIDLQISRLRQKIELNATQPTLIKTIRGSGYMFMVPVFSSKE